MVDVIVEFVGLPGAGKTTLCEDLQDCLAGTGFPLKPKEPMLGKRGALAIVFASLKYWRVSLLAIRVLMASPRPRDEKKMAARWFFSTLGLYGVPRGSTGSHMVVDEGILQRSFLLFLEQDGFGPIGRVTNYIASIPLPDVVVMVDLSPEESIGRLKVRGRPLPRRFRDLPESHQSAAFWKGAELLELVLRGAVGRTDSHTRVIRVPGNDLKLARSLIGGALGEEFPGAWPET